MGSKFSGLLLSLCLYLNKLFFYGNTNKYLSQDWYVHVLKQTCQCIAL